MNFVRNVSIKRPGKGLEGIFNTDKDLAYNFTTDMFDGNPIHIYSKGQFKALLKQYHLADASLKECRQEAEFRKKITEEDKNRNLRKAAEELFDKKRELLRFRRK